MVTKKVTEFRVGDKVICDVEDSGYSITRKGNGYGIVIEILKYEIRVEWYNKKGEKAGEHVVLSKYFKLEKINSWKDRLKNG